MRTVVFILFIFSICPIYTQNIYQGSIVLASQEEVDNFGNQDFEEINGSLRIEDGQTGAIVNLDGLRGLTHISGNLEIRNNLLLSSLTGLNDLISVGGFFTIYENNSLTSLNGLNNLIASGGLEILQNVDLQEKSGQLVERLCS